MGGSGRAGAAAVPARMGTRHPRPGPGQESRAGKGAAAVVAVAVTANNGWAPGGRSTSFRTRRLPRTPPTVNSGRSTGLPRPRPRSWTLRSGPILHRPFPRQSGLVTPVIWSTGWQARSLRPPLIPLLPCVVLKVLLAHKTSRFSKLVNKARHASCKLANRLSNPALMDSRTRRLSNPALMDSRTRRLSNPAVTDGRANRLSSLPVVTWADRPSQGVLPVSQATLRSPLRPLDRQQALAQGPSPRTKVQSLRLQE